MGAGATEKYKSLAAGVEPSGGLCKVSLEQFSALEKIAMAEEKKPAEPKHALDYFTFGLALLAFLLTCGGVAYSRLQVVEMQYQLGEMKKQTDAAKRSSTSNRAWIFVEATPENIDFKPLSDRGLPGGKRLSDLQATVKIQLKNAGQLPAVIESVHVVMLLSDAKEGPPDPDSHAGLPYRANDVVWLHHNDQQHTGWTQSHLFLGGDQMEHLSLDTRGFNFQMIPAGGVSSEMEGTFHFFRPAAEHPHVEPSVLWLDWQATWLYVVVRYRDVYSDDLETGFLCSFSWGDLTAPPPPLDKKYNYWK